jgi:NAD(P)-dependent dehydrogenase (short-subunit alcohol dehydrogenase family)
MQISLSSRTALISGSDRNTGRVIASALQRAGAEVVVHSNESLAAAEAAASETGAIAAVYGNIATEPGCDSVLSQLQELKNPVNILVNNYGTAGFARWDTATTEQWLDMYEKNMLCVARLVQGIVPSMQIAGWGRVINLGTIGSHRPGHTMPHYYAAKGALATYSVSLCQALAGTGITVNTVSPGLIHTPDLEAGYRARARKQGWGDNWADILAHIVKEDFPNPCDRLATREEVADLVVFLASDNASFINGQNIRIDGGAIAYV